MDRAFVFHCARVCTLKAFRAPDRTVDYLKTITDTAPDVLRDRFLLSLLTYARRASPFYKERIRPVFSDIPLLGKDDLRASLGQLRTPLADMRGSFRNASGGSTGTPTSFIQDRVYEQWGIATERYYLREFLGIDPLREQKVILWGSPRDILGQRNWKGRVSQWVNRTVLLNAFDAGETRWREFAAVINRTRPALVRGYANALSLFARFIRREKIALAPPRAVVSSAEVLRPDMRADIEAAFGARVYDFYGSREVGPIAGECRHGKKHLFIFNTVAEIVESANGECAPMGARGEVVVTALHNFSSPLVRYRIGDAGTFDDRPCACGSPLPVLKELHGRVADSLERRDGTVIDSGFFGIMLFEKPWVRNFQVTQRDYEHVVISIVGDRPTDGDRGSIDAGFRKALGDECRIDWEFVEKIPPTPQGKLLAIRNLIPNARAKCS
jgi:phenylacetate-CoA ligase